MKIYQACLLSGLLISGIAVAQDSSQAKSDSEGMNKKQATGKENTDSGKSTLSKQAKGEILSKKLTKSNIMNESDDEIGSITNIVMDKDGQVVGVITEVGGFLGMGEKNVALSWDSLEITKGDDDNHYQITTSMSKDELKNKEEYKKQDEVEVEKKIKEEKEKNKKLNKNNN